MMPVTRIPRQLAAAEANIDALVERRIVQYNATHSPHHSLM